MVDNALKGVLLGVGLIITVLLISMSIYVSNRGRDTSVAVADTLSQAEKALESTQYASYEGSDVQGYDVIDAISKYGKDVDIVVYRTNRAGAGFSLLHVDTLASGQAEATDDPASTAPMYHAIYFGDAVSGYDCERDALAFVNDPAKANTYINPMSKYTGYLVRNSNGAVNQVQFIETSDVTDLEVALWRQEGLGSGGGVLPGGGGGTPSSDEITNNLVAISNRLSEIEGKLAALDTNMAGTIEGLNEMSAGISQGFATLSDNITELSTSIGTYLTQVSTAMTSISDNMTGLVDIINELRTSGVGGGSGTTSSDDLTDIRNSLSNIQTTLGTMNTDIATILENTDGMETDEVVDKYNQLVQSYAVMVSYKNQLSDVVANMDNTVQQKSTLSSVVGSIADQLTNNRQVLISLYNVLVANGVESSELTYPD